MPKSRPVRRKKSTAVKKKAKNQRNRDFDRLVLSPAAGLLSWRNHLNHLMIVHRENLEFCFEATGMVAEIWLAFDGIATVKSIYLSLSKQHDIEFAVLKRKSDMSIAAFLREGLVSLDARKNSRTKPSSKKRARKK